jgi:hypothetical protein
VGTRGATGSQGAFARCSAGAGPHPAAVGAQRACVTWQAWVEVRTACVESTARHQLWKALSRCAARAAATKQRKAARSTPQASSTPTLWCAGVQACEASGGARERAASDKVRAGRSRAAAAAHAAPVKQLLHQLLQRCGRAGAAGAGAASAQGAPRPVVRA